MHQYGAFILVHFSELPRASAQMRGLRQHLRSKIPWLFVILLAWILLTLLLRLRRNKAGAPLISFRRF
jgi:hypothetical protein